MKKKKKVSKVDKKKILKKKTVKKKTKVVKKKTSVKKTLKKNLPIFLQLIVRPSGLF